MLVLGREGSSWDEVGMCCDNEACKVELKSSIRSPAQVSVFQALGEKSASERKKRGRTKASRDERRESFLPSSSLVVSLAQFFFARPQQP